MFNKDPVGLSAWIEANKHRLQPPVGNAQLWEGRDFVVTVVSGPNRRTDYHDDPFEEVFYQLKGDIALRIQDGGKVRDVPVREGEFYVLPRHVRHSPQRPAGSLGLILERQRGRGVVEAFEWYCDNCNGLLHRDEVEIESFDELPKIFRRFYGNTALHICGGCGHAHSY